MDVNVPDHNVFVVQEKNIFSFVLSSTTTTIIITICDSIEFGADDDTLAKK